MRRWAHYTDAPHPQSICGGQEWGGDSRYSGLTQCGMDTDKSLEIREATDSMQKGAQSESPADWRQRENMGGLSGGREEG